MYHSFKIKLDKKSKELKDEFIEYKINVVIIPFDSPYAIIPNISKIKNKIDVRDYLKNGDPSELCIPSKDQFLIKLVNIFKIF
jgi:hypothetical protein